ncbi:hypothetical protein BJ508DRAFT_332246 [Ascobolus immersus RN42]|uniref:Uncharacterized protein n=1 Tax=Ascobolus immersus RN42 TaxID=1160509 RepID=A0A3N4HN82_ASCIM|nr:hypothetical protein BJ508DRAFT_332246 [Ascobolus immersus RN42]
MPSNLTEILEWHDKFIANRQTETNPCEFLLSPNDTQVYIDGLRGFYACPQNGIPSDSGDVNESLKRVHEELQKARSAQQTNKPYDPEVYSAESTAFQRFYFDVLNIWQARLELREFMAHKKVRSDIGEVQRWMDAVISQCSYSREWDEATRHNDKKGLDYKAIVYYIRDHITGDT